MPGCAGSACQIALTLSLALVCAAVGALIFLRRSDDWMALFVSLGAFSAYAYALSTLPVSTVATYAYVNPVIAVLLGVVVAGERFSVPHLAGGASVLVAVVMVIAAERRGRPPASAGVTGPARPTRPVAGRPPPC